MPAVAIARPAVGEYAPYYGRYIELIPEENLLQVLDRQHDTTMALLRSIPEDRSTFRYAPDKWTVKEVVGHVLDFERIFGYRALRIARNDQTPIPGAEQDDYVANAAFDSRSMFDLASEFHHLRQANIFLFRSLTTESLARRGVANGQEISVRALGFIIAGHERHHMDILRQRYLT